MCKLFIEMSKNRGFKFSLTEFLALSNQTIHGGTLASGLVNCWLAGGHWQTRAKCHGVESTLWVNTIRTYILYISILVMFLVSNMLCFLCLVDSSIKLGCHTRVKRSPPDDDPQRWRSEDRWGDLPTQVISKAALGIWHSFETPTYIRVSTSVNRAIVILPTFQLCKIHIGNAWLFGVRFATGPWSQKCLEVCECLTLSDFFSSVQFTQDFDTISNTSQP